MVRSHPLELIDTRFALRTYAAVVGLAGFILAAWGQIWLGSHLAELPWGRAVLIRLCGAVMIGAASYGPNVAPTARLME